MVAIGPKDLILIEEVTYHCVSRARLIVKEHPIYPQLLFTFRKKDWNSFEVMGKHKDTSWNDGSGEKMLGQIPYIPEGMAIRDLFEIVMWKVAANLVHQGLKFKGYGENPIYDTFQFGFIKEK